MYDLDFSQNNLQGIIPKLVVELSSLTILLNLDKNQLFRLMPLEVGNLRNIRHLDVSGNKLTIVFSLYALSNSQYTFIIILNIKKKYVSVNLLK